MAHIIQTHDYDLEYDPAMPMMEVGLSKPEDTDRILSVTAIIDSGADATIIPIQILKQMEAVSVDEMYLRGITGKRSRVKLYSIVVHISEHRVYGIRAIAGAQRNEIIIGRDVLNQLEVTLNGIAEVTEVRA